MSSSNSPVYVSIAMATYQGEKFLHKQLESLASQSRLPDELVVCDDNSKDHTIQIIKEFADKVSFPVLILRNSQNQGFVSTFNRALEATKGDLVFLCDQDDFWFPKKIEFTCNLAEENPNINLFMNNAELVDGELNPSGFTTFGQMNSAGQNPQDLVLGCCMAVRRELLELCLPIPGNFSAHDIWLHEFSSFLSSKLVVPEILQYYRRHQKNETAHIVYSLHKINQLDYMVDFYKKLCFGRTKNSLSQRITDHKLRIATLTKATQKLNGATKGMLETALDRVNFEYLALELRHEISRKNLFQRIYCSTQLLLAGKYQSGFKSYIRDILGNT